jgi:uridine phosphorylase
VRLPLGCGHVGSPVFDLFQAYYIIQTNIFAGPVGGSVSTPPIFDNKDSGAASVFEPAALLREARRQKGLVPAQMPSTCILDPDGDVVRHLRDTGQAERSASWPCYHTDLYEFDLAGEKVGIIGCAVGAPFAVLVAEELFACGCQVLISLTSAGQIVPAGNPPYFVIIDRALRDEGTSYHYASPAIYAKADRRLVTDAANALRQAGLPAFVGSSWTTDAPFRETEAAVAAARAKGVLTVEMEAAALYAFARHRGNRVLCLAHVTNTMGLADHDFEKGEAQGARDALQVLGALCKSLRPHPESFTG